MKVLLINGSPHKNGCTATALSHVAKTLEESGIETEVFNIGTGPVYGCLGCGACGKLGKCINDDIANEIIAKLDEVDGLVVGSPVYYASSNGALTAVLDRVFYAGGSKLRFKVGAAVCSARRAGTTATLDRLLKYFAFNNMPIASSCYWPMVHGRVNKAEDAEQDLEGVAIMEQLGRNMAWLMKSIEAGKEAGIEPDLHPKPAFNYVR